MTAMPIENPVAPPKPSVPQAKPIPRSLRKPPRFRHAASPDNPRVALCGRLLNVAKGSAEAGRECPDCLAAIRPSFHQR